MAESAVYISVNEDYANKHNTAIALLYVFLFKYLVYKSLRLGLMASEGNIKLHRMTDATL